MATVAAPLPSSDADVATVGDLIDRFGPIPLSRIRFEPAPGTATEADLLEANSEGVGVFELVDGVLVEKAMSLKASRVAMRLAKALMIFVDDRGLGFCGGEAGVVKLPASGRWRAPDVSFFRDSPEAEAALDRDAYPELVPALAVEVLSPSNTGPEIERKVAEFLAAGVELVWVVDPERKSAVVYRADGSTEEVAGGGQLLGEPVLAGFRLTLDSIFA